MKCPFEYCEATLAPVPQRRSPTDSSLEYVYPQHRVTGPGEWYGMCPASQMTVPHLIPAHRRPTWEELTPYAAALLRDSRRIYGRMRSDRQRQRIETLRQEEQRKQARRTAGLPAPHADGPVGGETRPPMLPTADYFPGRPADNDPMHPQPKPAPEAPSMDSLREQLMALVNLTIEGIGQSQELEAAATHFLSLADAKLHEVGIKLEANVALARAAVGSDAPESAEAMVAALVSGLEEIRYLRETTSAQLSVIARAFTRLIEAVNHAEAYRAQLSR